MGTILYSADDEPLADHEGYVAYILEDGSSAGGTWTAEIDERIAGWRAECSCGGWHGPTFQAGAGDGRTRIPDDRQHDRVMLDWETAHARPLLVDLEVRSRLGRLSEQLRTAEARLRQAVEQYRAEGITWGQIGQALGVSRQAAWNRFGGSAEVDTNTRSATRTARAEARQANGDHTGLATPPRPRTRTVQARQADGPISSPPARTPGPIEGRR